MSVMKRQKTRPTFTEWLRTGPRLLSSARPRRQPNQCIVSVASVCYNLIDEIVPSKNNAIFKLFRVVAGVWVV